MLFHKKNAENNGENCPILFYEGSVTGVSESGGVICVVGVQQFEGQTKAFSFR